MMVAASSYIIYLFHTTFEGFAKAVVHKIPIFVDTSNELLFIVKLPLWFLVESLHLAYCIAMYLIDIPSQRYCLD